MAIPHPFKTRRTTGSPTAGGNVHTLAQHMASPQAHPQYVKKGDQVGSMNISDHELSSIAHRVHLLRRAELALTVDDFNSTKNVDPVYYDADHHTNIEVAYKTVITSALLHALLGTENNLDNGPLSYILHKNQMIHTEEAMNSLSDAVAQSRVPSMALIKIISGKISDFIEKSVADTLYSSINHDHDGVYAFEQHTHSLYDVYVTVGGTKIYPARADHNHDDVYWRKDEPIESTTDLSPLAVVGIYPNSITTEAMALAAVDLNDRTTQSHESLWIRKRSLEKLDSSGNPALVKNFPDQFMEGIKNSGYILNSEKGYTYRQSFDIVRDSSKEYYRYTTGSGYTLIDFDVEEFDPDDVYYHKIPTPLLGSENSLVAACTLTVRKATVTDMTLSSDEASEYLTGNPRESAIGLSVIQTLITNASIKELDRAGSSEVEKALVKNFKNALYGVYTRNGYSFETARWISSLLSVVFETNPDKFHTDGQADSNGDAVSAVADLVNQRFATIFAQYAQDETSAPSGVIPGYMLVDSERYSGRKMRANRQVLISTASDLLGIDPEESASITDETLLDGLTNADPSELADAFVDFKLNGKYNPVYDQSKVVVHDLSSWILGGSVTASTFSVANALDSVYNATAFVPYDSSSPFLPYIEYYAIDDRYVGVLDFVNPVDVSKYFVQQLIGGTYTYGQLTTIDPQARYFVDVNNVTTNTDAALCAGSYEDLSKNENSDLNIDGTSRTLHGYLPIKKNGPTYEVTTDSAPVTGKTYYTYNGITYVEFTGSEFVSGTTYYEKHVYNTTYLNGGEYFVMLENKSSSGLNQFYQLSVGTHYVVGGPVGCDMLDHNKELDVSTIPNALSNQVYMRVAISVHPTEYRVITAAEREAGPVEGTQYFTLDSDGTYTPIEDTLTEFSEDTEYYVSYTTRRALWSKVPVRENTRYNSSLHYYSWADGLSWNDVTDEVEEDLDGNVIIPSNRTIFVDWTDVYQAAVDPERYATTPEIGATNVLMRGLFYQSFDMEWMPGKRYYQQATVGGRTVFKRITVKPFGDNVPPYGCVAKESPVYEVIDVERMLDVWCAIVELTTTGALQTVGDDTIVYNFGNDGVLVTWDKWTRIITDRDAVIQSLQSAGSSLVDRLSTLDQTTTFEDIWSNSHTHSNKSVLDKISGHKTGTEYDYILIDMKRVALYSELTSLDTEIKSVARAAVSGTQIVGGGSAVKLVHPIKTEAKAFTLKISIRPTDPSTTLDEILRPATGYITILTMSETSDRNTGVAGNINIRMTPTGVVSLIDPMPSGATLQYTRNFTTLGKAMSWTLSGVASSTARNVAIGVATSRSSAATIGRFSLDYGAQNNNINYIWVHDGITVQIDWIGENFVDSDDGLGRVAGEAARLFIPYDHYHVNKEILDAETSTFDYVLCSGSSTDWATAINDVVEYDLSTIQAKLPVVAADAPGKLHTSFYLKVQSNTESLVEYAPVVQPVSTVKPVTAILDVTNSKLRVKDLKSLCVTALTGVDVQKVATGTDLTAELHMRLSTRHVTNVV